MSLPIPKPSSSDSPLPPPPSHVTSISTAVPPRPALTQRLLASSPSAFLAATQCAFLSHAGKGTLSKSVVQNWLGQDRLYAQAYVRFVGLLVANVPLLGTVGGGSVNEQLQDLLVSSLTNIRRELKFFEDVASRYGLDISVSDVDGGPRARGKQVAGHGVKAYRQLFKEIGEGVEAGTTEMLDAMIVLWGTEKCYLSAWRYAASFSSPSSSSPPSSSPINQDKDGGALRNEFIPNWTSDEFEVFVDAIGEMVGVLWADDKDEFVSRWRVKCLSQAGGKVGYEREVRKVRVLGLWERLLGVEALFWPAVGEDGEGVDV